jgi:hypothetical protein
MPRCVQQEELAVVLRPANCKVAARPRAAALRMTRSFWARLPGQRPGQMRRSVSARLAQDGVGLPIDGHMKWKGQLQIERAGSPICVLTG